MDHLERVKLPGQAWNTMEESGSGGSRSVTVSDTADPAQVATISDPLDTRGVGSIGLFLETTVWDDVSDYLNIIVLTRKAGRPFMPAYLTQQGTPGPGDTSLVLVSQVNQNGPLRYLKFAAVGLLDESVVIAQPVGSGVGLAQLDLQTISFRPILTTGGDWPNAYGVEYLDPGVANSPLSFDSADGWIVGVHLATDNDAVIATNSSDIDFVLDPSTDLGNVFFSLNDSGPATVTAEPLAPFAGGVAGVTAGITYELTATY